MRLFLRSDSSILLVNRAISPSRDGEHISAPNPSCFLPIYELH
jgi:hypothetical protein